MRTYEVISRFIKSYSVTKSQHKHKRPVKSHLALVSALLSVLSVPNLPSLSPSLPPSLPPAVFGQLKCATLQICRVKPDWLSFTSLALLKDQTVKVNNDLWLWKARYVAMETVDHLLEELTCEAFLLVERPA